MGRTMLQGLTSAKPVRPCAATARLTTMGTRTPPACRSWIDASHARPAAPQIRRRVLRTSPCAHAHAALTTQVQLESADPVLPEETVAQERVYELQSWWPRLDTGVPRTGACSF